LIQRELKAHLGQLAHSLDIGGAERRHSGIGRHPPARRRDSRAGPLGRVRGAINIQNCDLCDARPSGTGRRRGCERGAICLSPTSTGSCSTDIAQDSSRRISLRQQRFIASLRALDFVVPTKPLEFSGYRQFDLEHSQRDYTVEGEDDALQPLPAQDMQAASEAEPHRRPSQIAGYTYVHFENGYDYLTECASTSRDASRQSGSRRARHRDLSNTPIVT